MKILVVKLGALGDVINTLPLVVNIKQQTGWEIHWLVAPLSRPLVSAHPCVDQVFVFDKKQAMRSFYAVTKKLRRHSYDVVLDLQRILKSGLFTAAVKARRRIGFDRARSKELSWLFPFERLGPGPGTQHMLDHYLDFLVPLNIGRLPVEWRIPRRDPGPLPVPQRFVVLNIGATKPANRWAPDNFARLAREIHEQWQLPCVLTGGREDQSAAAGVTARAGSSVLDLTGRTSLGMLTEILARADYVVTCDTGPMHLARALGTRVIALFGPSDPQRTGPYKGRVIQKLEACGLGGHGRSIPCNRQTCPSPQCMAAIQPSDVIAEMQEG